MAKVTMWIGGAVVVVAAGVLVGLCGRCARHGTFEAASQPLRGFQIVLEERNPWAENEDRLCDIHGARNGDIVVARGKIPFTSAAGLLDASNWRDEYYVVVRGGGVLKLVPCGRAWTQCYRQITPVEVTGELATKARTAMEQKHVHATGASIETYPGIWDRPSATRPLVFPPDLYGGDYYEWNEERELDALYRMSCIRYLKFLEDRDLAVKGADTWVQHYIDHLTSRGFTVVRRDVGKTIGSWVRWGARLVNSKPNSEWLFTTYSKIVEVDIEFGYGRPEVWYKLEYAEYEEVSGEEGSRDP
jgi:hypothetical protein